MPFGMISDYQMLVTLLRRNLPFDMGRGKSKSFKPAKKDKPRVAVKKSKKSKNTGIIHGRVESAKTEQKVSLFSLHH